MPVFRLIPILGLKTAVAQNDPSMLVPVSGSNGAVAMSHACAGSINVDYLRIQRACNKAQAKVQWSNSAVETVAAFEFLDTLAFEFLDTSDAEFLDVESTTTRCLGIHQLYDGTNYANWVVYDGEIYRYDSNRDPQQVADASSTTFANSEGDLYCMISIGGYMVFTDWGEHTPYKSDHNDATLTKLLLAGNEYAFRYIEAFQNRIIGAHDTSTGGLLDANGNISVRWTDKITGGWGSLEAPAANQLYRATDDPITGIKRMGQNACFLYGQDSIDRLDYYASYSTPFGLTTMVSNNGCTGHHSIINLGDRHLFFSKDLGFVEYRGGQTLRVISEDIDDICSNITTDYMARIVGAQRLIGGRKAAWSVPLAGSTIPNALLFYDVFTGQWERHDQSMRFIASMDLEESFSWEDLADFLGGPPSEWDIVESGTVWTDYTGTRLPRMVMSNNDGHLYYHGGETDAGSAYSGTRIEPIVDFGNSHRKDLLKEVWFSINYRGNYNIDVYHRGGNTEAEVKNQSWTSIGSISCQDPDPPAVFLQAKSNRLHQIKWETDGANERFAVNYIDFVYSDQSAR